MVKKLLPKITSLADLRIKAARDERYAKLLITAAENLGWPQGGHLNFPISSLRQKQAMHWLLTNALETESEAGVVDEINFCRDLV